MSTLRADIWVSAFVRAHNNRGNICVVSRRGHEVSGQIWIEVDHLDGTGSLFSPAPMMAYPPEATDMLFQVQMEHAPMADIAERLRREQEFDPDFWHIVLESRSPEPGLNLWRPEN